MTIVTKSVLKLLKIVLEIVLKLENVILFYFFKIIDHYLDTAGGLKKEKCKNAF